MKLRNNIPNFITLLNLISGSIAIIMALSGELVIAGWFIIIAAIFDFLDGLAARVLKARSEMGAQLDSLGDVISFGLAPSIIMYVLMWQSPDLPYCVLGNYQLLPFTALLIVAASAWRLAKFNTDPDQAYIFKGLPTPATGLFVASWPLILMQFEKQSGSSWFLNDFYTLLAVVVFLSALMVSRMPMLSLKFKNLKLQDNIARYALLVCLVILFIVFRFSAIPMIILLYIIISILTVSKPDQS